MFNRSDYKRWEIVLLLFAILTFSLAILLYFSGFSLQSIFFGLNEEESQSIGILTNKKGSIQRELNTNSGFNLIENGANLYNFDTILTNSEGSATIQLNDGGIIELTPNTMLRLTLENHLDSDGLYRAYHVEVFNGQVSAKAKQTKFILKNKENIIFVAKGENKEIISKKKTIEEPVSFKTKYTLKHGAILPSFPSYTPAPLPSPKPSPSPSPVVTPKLVKKPMPLPKKVVTKPILKPTPIPSKTPEPVKKTEADPLMFVEIPVINYPPNNSYYFKKAIDSSSEKRILLTWSRKKHFQGFDVEISTDSNFNKLLVSTRVYSNFYSFYNPPVGNYWWRIRSLATDSQSGFTEKRFFKIK